MHGATPPSRRLVQAAFVAMLGVYFFSYFHRSAVPGTIFNELQQEWNLSASAIVAISSVSLWIYGLMQLPAGILIDRYGGTRMMLVGGSIAAVGATLFPLARTPAMLYACRGLAAFGDSFIYLCLVKELSLLFARDRFAMLTGITQFAGVLGGVMAMLPFERATHLFGWQTSLLAMGLLMVATMGGSFWVLPKLKHFTPHKTPWTLQPVWDILRNRRNWPIFFISAINFPIYFVLQVGIGKKFIQDFVGLSSKQAATFTLVMMMATAALCFASGFLLRHTGGRRKPYLVLAGGTLLGAAVLLLAGVLGHARAWVFLAAYILMATSNIAGPIWSIVMKELNDDRHVGQALALLNTLAYFGVAILMMLSGTVLDLFCPTPTQSHIIYPPQAYATLFAIFAGLATVSLIVTSVVHETQGRPASDLPVAAEIP